MSCRLEFHLVGWLVGFELTGNVEQVLKLQEEESEAGRRDVLEQLCELEMDHC